MSAYLARRRCARFHAVAGTIGGRSISATATRTTIIIFLTSCGQLWPAASTTQAEVVPPLLGANVKHWTRSSQFNEPSNWLNGLKPCSLRQRVRLDEETVVSMADALQLSGEQSTTTIGELLLAPDGVLLLEPDTFQQDGSQQESWLQFLNESGDCSAHPTNQFVFKMHSNQISWFDPQNWAQPDRPANRELLPESHLIPCVQDWAVFGKRADNEQTALSGRESEHVLGFKVNFESSEATRKRPDELLDGGYLSVGRIMIGELAFDSQSELDQLINSESQYNNLLFDFEKGLIKDYQLRLLGPNQAADCAAGPGCVCGNERAPFLAAICSFVDRPQPDELACRDPVASTGYCNQICASVLRLNIEPSRFQESFLLNRLTAVGEDHKDQVLAVPRRVAPSTYEITFWHLEQGQPGDELLLARALERDLTRAPFKSFFGIKSIELKASQLWKAHSLARQLAGPISIVVALVLMAVAIFVHSPQAATLTQTSGHRTNERLVELLVRSVGRQLASLVDSVKRGNHDDQDDRETLVVNYDSQAGQHFPMTSTTNQDGVGVIGK